MILPQLACEETNEGFSKLEEKAALTEKLDEILEKVKIVSFSPEDDPVVMTNTSTEVFAISVNPGSGDTIKYSWSLDGEVAEDDVNGKAFYILDGRAIQQGAHELVVTASNELGADSKTFNVVKSTDAAEITAYNPIEDNVVILSQSSQTFTFSATGTGRLVYWWERNGTRIPNATNNTYHV